MVNCESPFAGLDAMINQPLYPHIIDLNKMALTGLLINQVITHIRYKLQIARLGFDIKMLFIGPKESLPLVADYHFVKSHMGRNSLEAYLLTWAAGGQDLITPPYAPGEAEPISWNEYGCRVIADEELKINIRIPWAQAKFINIGKTKED